MKKFTFILFIGFAFTFLLGCTYSGPIEIVYHLNNYEDNVTLNYDDRENVSFYADFSRDGYRFLGWYMDEELTEQVSEEDLIKINDNSIDLYASWEKESFSISYYMPDGSLLFTEEYDFLDKVTAFTDLPELEGYTFEGWDKIVPAKMPSSDVVLTAVYDINQYLLTYHNSFLDYEVSKSVDFNARLTLLTPTQPGYTFEGWYIDEAKTIPFTDEYMPSNDVTLYSKWSKTIFNIYFNSFDSSIITPIEIQMDNIVDELPEVSVPGLVFEGWYYDGIQLSAPFTYAYDSDIELTSRWSDELGLIYELFSDHAEITGYKGTSTVLTFPNEVASRVVLSVQKSAFEGNTVIEKIIANQDLASVEYKGFANMSRLQSVLFSTETTSFGQNVFFNDSSLEELTISLNLSVTLPQLFGVNYVDIPTSFTKIIVAEGTTESNDTFVSSFYPHVITLYLPHSWTEITKEMIGNASMTEVWIPNTITRIGMEAFYNDALNVITFEEGSTLTTIEERAFWDTDITSLTIPSTVTTIEPGAFVGMLQLQNIVVSEGNEYYTVENNVLYNIDKTVLILYSAKSLNDSFTVPSSVQYIESYAFLYAYNLLHFDFETNSQLIEIRDNGLRGLRYVDVIYLPSGLEKIGDEAFSTTASLKYIFIPNSVEYIGDNVFSYTLSMRAVLIESDSPKDGWSDIAFGNTSTIIYGYLYTTEIDHIKYVIDSLNQATLVEFMLSELSEDVVIPETVAGFPVVRIGSYAFYRTNIYGTLTIPDNVVQIDAGAFAMCYVQHILFKETSNLLTIKNSAFANFGSDEIVLPDSLQTIEMNAFFDAQVVQIYIPSSVTTLGEYALYSHYNRIVLFEGDASQYGTITVSDYGLTILYFNQENPYLVHNDYWTYE